MRRLFYGAVTAALLSTSTASAERAAPRARPPTGDRDGLALLARVHRAYDGIPAVAVSGQAGTLSFRWTLVLGSGIGVAEQFVGREPSGVTMLVAHRGGPTFAREQGSSCWRALRSSDRQALDNLGLPFPDQPAMRVRAPRVTRTGWLLPVVVDGDAGTFAVERSSAQVRTITIGVGHPILERVTALRSAPRLPPAEPRC